MTIDRDALNNDSQEAWDNLDWAESFNHIEKESIDAAKFLELARETFHSDNLVDLIQLFDGTLYSIINNAVEEARASFRDNWEDNNQGDYEEESESPYESLRASEQTRSIIDCGSDDTVGGGEIRTIGALRPMQFLSAINDLLENNEFEVDTCCSFHIHLSVLGIKHSYDARLQAEMIAYILDNKTRLPESVHHRLVSDNLDRFARPHISTEKHTAVRFHSVQRTWEFRLFGNVSNSSDARRCLIIAIEALRWAYRVKLRLERPLVTQKIITKFHSVAERACEQGGSFVKERRSIATAAHSAA